MGNGLKYLGLLVIFSLWAACADKTVEVPARARFNLKMATEGASLFETYIHSLNIYAFRKTAGNKYVYARTLGELDAADIAALKDASPQGDTKYFPAELAVGTYMIYMAGNAAGQIEGPLVEDETTPQELMIRGNDQGDDSVYFLGHALITVVTEYMTPVRITLTRAVSKLVLVLYGVPVQMDSVRMSLTNIAGGVSLDGTLSGESKRVEKTLAVSKSEGRQKDTLVGEVITLPSLSEGAGLQLLFYAANGQLKEKVMPVQALLPDRYVRLAGMVNDNPGALLSFEVKMKFILVDYWMDQKLPDFTLNKEMP